MVNEIKFDAGHNKTCFLKKRQIEMMEELAAKCSKIDLMEIFAISLYWQKKQQRENKK